MKQVKKKGRPPKKVVITSLENAETNVNNDEVNNNAPNEVVDNCEAADIVNLDNANETISAEQDEKAEECTEIDQTKEELTSYVDKNNITWTPHKYNIGDMVWVPVDEVVNVAGLFMPIKTVLQKVAKKFTVASVVYTNKVSYTFKETSKVIASEVFVTRTQSECEELCKQFNE